MRLSILASLLLSTLLVSDFLTPNSPSLKTSYSPPFSISVTAAPMIGYLGGHLWKGVFEFVPDFFQFVFADFFVAIASPKTGPVGDAINHSVQDFGRSLERQGRRAATSLRVRAKENFGTLKGERLEEWSATVEMQSKRAATAIIALGPVGDGAWSAVQTAFFRAGIAGFVGQFPTAWYTHLTNRFV